MANEIIVDENSDIPSILEAELAPKIQQEMKPENRELATQMLHLAISNKFRDIENLINSKINEIMEE